MSTLLEDINEAMAALTAAFVADPFTRTYVSAGPPAMDCDQLVGYVDRLYNGGPLTDISNRPVRKQSVPTAEITFATLRCVTAFEHNKLPSAAKLGSEGARHHTDGELLWRTLTAGVGDGTLFANRSFRMGQATPLGPAGGVAGWSVTLQVELALSTLSS